MAYRKDSVINRRLSRLHFNPLLILVLTQSVLGGKNMSNLIKVKCDETVIWIEVEGAISDEEGPQKVSVSESMEETIIAFDEISDTIRAYCTSLVKTFKGLQTEIAPNKIIAEFGLTL